MCNDLIQYAKNSAIWLLNVHPTAWKNVKFLDTYHYEL